MNGDEVAKLKSYDDGQWRVYIAGELRIIKNAIDAQGTALAEVVSKQHETDIKIATLPTQCGEHTKMECRVKTLEEERAGRTAVNRFVFGASGLSVLGVTVLLLKVFGVF